MGKKLRKKEAKVNKLSDKADLMNAIGKTKRAGRILKRADAKASRVNKKVQKKTKKAVKKGGLGKAAVNVSRMRIGKTKKR